MGHKIANTIFKTKNKVRGFMPPNFRTSYKATVIKAVWDRH